ncbi:hypothetical protein [Selenihalanaerobacter shriftii]|uniref:Uncharacterized protein n=1 Tax=Selenihalanaerobacter shriftii TaxID=142842 RepID=A0A1T4QCQ5_9FIRM|nr:hypothetical protein [Selenihalanaerobacter shriftii]SKA01008.1 hypothetical protein SAMN02745118_02493 [Selenihalanaerobacter shriftii]
MFEKFITELSAKLTIDNLNQLKESDPKKYDETLKLFIVAAEVGTKMLKESPKFRKVFAEIHAEFLKYPESKEVIETALNANKKINS